MKKIFFIFLLLFILSACFSRNSDFNREKAVDLSGSKGEEKLHYSYSMDKVFFDSLFAETDTFFEERKIYGLISPHHLLAAKQMAALFKILESQDIGVIAIVGPNHFNAGKNKILISGINYATPYGVLETEKNIINDLVSSGLFSLEEEPFGMEHSISVLTPFIKKIKPEAKIIPIILSMDLEEELAEQVGLRLNRFLPSNSLVIASADFAHHVDWKTATEMDRKSIKTIKEFNFDRIYNIEVDSKASIYALLSYLKQKRAKNFILTDNTNAAEIINDYDYDDVTSYVLGYFVKEAGNILTKSDQPFKMLFFGDMMLDRYVGEIIKKHGFDYLFERLIFENEDFFIDYDFVSANLEGAVTDNGAHYPPHYAYDFAFAPEIINRLHDYNFTFFNLANNHISDQGERGVLETRKKLTELGFNFSGCADGQAGECSATTTEINNLNIGLAGFSMVYGLIDKTEITDIISSLASTTDLVIVNMHWGVEYGHQFNKTQQNYAYAIIDAGADIIIGHHPHVVQGLELYNNKPIFYSLGNFIFDQYFSPDTQEGLAVGIDINERKTTIFLFPLKSKLSQPELMKSEEKENFLKKFIKWSKIDDEKIKEEILIGRFELK